MFFLRHPEPVRPAGGLDSGSHLILWALESSLMTNRQFQHHIFENIVIRTQIFSLDMVQLL